MATHRSKQFAKDLISGLPGGFGLAAMDLIYRCFRPEAMALRHKQDEIYSKLGRPDHILAGPFVGMKYIDRATGSEFLPKILGTYELELIDAVEQICRLDSDRILDIGAAEGYYAVGLLVRNATKNQIICYDIYRPARYLLKSLASLNHVSGRIDLRARCDPNALERDLVKTARPVIICDCEGYEQILMDPAAVPSLRKAMILVELHEQFVPGVTELLHARFNPTHDIHVYNNRPRTADLLPPGCSLTSEETAYAMDERRSQAMQWFLLVPRQISSIPTASANSDAVVKSV